MNHYLNKETEFARDYELVTVTWDEPEYEDVEVVRWVNVYPESILCFATEGEANEAAADNRIACVKLTGTYRRRKPEPEVREQYVCEATDDVPYAAAIPAPKEWISKKVRVEVIP